MKMEKRKERKLARFGTNLPQEIWEEIGKRLISRLDLTRFRSVCKTWRSSLSPPSRFPLRVPPPPIVSDSKFHSVPFFVVEQTYYSYDTVSSEQDDKRRNRMLMVLDEVDQGGKFHPRGFVPVLRDYLNPNNRSDPPIPNLSRLSFLSKAYQLQMAVPRFLHQKRVKGKWRFDPCWDAQVRKTVLIFEHHPTSVNLNYVRDRDLTIVVQCNQSMGGELILLRLGDPNWKTDFCTAVYRDIISYNGKLYTVDWSGRAFVMDYYSLQMTQVAAPLLIAGIARIHSINFVEALGHLYLIVVAAFSYDLKVYKLISHLQKWIEVQGWDDQVFLVYMNHNFSVPRHMLANTGLMDLRYKMLEATFCNLTLVFSHGTNGSDDFYWNEDERSSDRGTEKGGDGLLTFVPMLSRPCINSWHTQAPPMTATTTATSSVFAQLESSVVARTNYFK